MWKITKGSKSVSPVIKLYQSAPPGGDPLDTTSYTEITACFQNEDGTDLVVSLTGGAIARVGNPLLGKLTISLTAAQTALLAAGAFKTLELKLRVGLADPDAIQIPGAYEIIESVC